ncbi:MAG: hypothetical protein V1720_19415 [bacterium]
MDVTINYLLRDANALKGTVNLNRSAMDEGGFTEENYLTFTTAIEDLQAKETAQQNAVENTGEKTAVQNETLERIRKLVSDIRAAAKSTYGKDQRNLKLFKVGTVITKSVKNLIPVVTALNELVTERKLLLMKNGLTQVKIDALAAAASDLNTVDKEQENAKSLQKTRTIERDTAAKNLQEQVFKIRNFAKACFSDRPEILVQFKPIPKGRSGAGNGEIETPPENSTPPAS